MKSRWESEIGAGVTQLDEEVERRRAISSHDAVADGIAYATSEIKLRMTELVAPGRELSPAEWAAEQDPPVTEQTARNWIRAGELDARPGAKGYLVLATAKRVKKVAQAEAAA